MSVINPFDQNRLLGRGVNIVGYDPIWSDRSQGRFQAKHFKLIRAAGFQHVRINLCPFRHMDEALTIAPAWLETLDWFLAESLAAGLAVIFDLHEFVILGEELEANLPKLTAAWRQLADRYAGAPDSVLFEPLNEPNKAFTAELWNAKLLELRAIIREKHPARTLILGPAHWNNIDYLDRLELPEDDRNIIATVHYYSPMPFTHQGAYWTEWVNLAGIEWHGTPAECAAVDADLGRAQAWAERHDRPLYLGEFGAYDKADMPSRVRYTRYVARRAEALGWSWGYWQWDSDFILYDIDRDAWVEPIREALME